MHVELPPSETPAYLRDNPYENRDDGVRDCQNKKAVKPTPIPRMQLCVVILIQLAEPITGTVIYPFINQFLRGIGTTQGDDRQVGYYVGLTQSVFFIAETLTVLQWGWLSDQFGRRPVLLLGPLGLALAMLGFGLSTSFLPLLAFRCLQGVFNGNIGVAKSVMAEIADETNIGEIFSVLPLLWSVGITAGPLIGGVFANPADRWPHVFGNMQLMQDHPYFLPCLLAGSLAFVSFMFGLVALRETLPTAPMRLRCKRQLERLNLKLERSPSLSKTSECPDYGTVSSNYERATSTATKEVHTQKAASYQRLLVRPLLTTYLNYFFAAFTEMAHTALLPLMYSTSIELGGLGLDPYQIGMLMGTCGLVTAVLQLKFLGHVTRRYGPRRVYMVAYPSFLLCIGLFPVESYLCRRNGGVNWAVGMVVALQLIAQIPVLACYASIHILVVTNAPKEALGASNGIGQMIASGTRSIAPAVVTSLFSVSLERNLASGYMVYCALLVFVCIGIRASFLLPR